MPNSISIKVALLLAIACFGTGAGFSVLITHTAKVSCGPTPEQEAASRAAFINVPNPPNHGNPRY